MSIRRLRPSARLHLVALGCCGLFAFLMLHPLIFTTGTHTSGYDFFNYHWNYWWARHALTTPGLELYATNFTMFPYTTNLGYHALTLVWFPLWALLEPLIGTFAVFNLIIFTACTLNGYLCFALFRRERIAPTVALIGALALQALPILRYFYYNTHLNLMDWFWLPAHLLLWGTIIRRAAQRRYAEALLWSAVQGIAFWATLLTDLQFPIFVAFLLAPYGIVTFLRSRAKPALIVCALTAVGVGGALMWFAGPIPHILEFEGTLAPGTVEDRPGIPLSGFLSMSREWWEWSAPSLGAFITVVIVASLIVSIIYARRLPRDRWLWFALMLPPLLFALGPNLAIGEHVIPLFPFRWLHTLTDGMFRMPWRLAPIFVIAALVFVGKTWTPLIRSLNARLVVTAAALPLLALSVRLFEPAPLTPVPTIYSFYEDMRAEDAPYVVLEIPTGAATGEVILGDPRATQLQYYTIIHEKRLINGFISRAPLEHFWYMLTDDPMLSWLGQRRYLEPELVEPQLRQRIADYPIGYAVIHRDLIGRDSSTVVEILGYFNSLGELFCPYRIEGDAVAYRTSAHPDGCAPRIPPEVEPDVYQIDIGSPGDEWYIGWGWHYQEQVFNTTLRWAGEQPQADLYVNLPVGAYTVEVAAQAYHEARIVDLHINGVPLEQPAEIPTGELTVVTFEVPASAVDADDLVKFTLDYDGWRTPAENGEGDTRRLAVAVDWIRFTRRAASQ